jgi:chemotaxis protein methyltransferase CheR
MPSVADDGAVADIEIPLLLEAIFRRYGYDFRDYAPVSLRRRIDHAMRELGIDSVSVLQGRLLRQPPEMARFLDLLTVDVTAMFRDPGFFRALAEKVLPRLAAASHLRVWHAGCSGGEEVYSLAILLHEAGLLERTQIYATDFNGSALARGQAGIFPLRAMREYTANYQKAGGKADFSAYYTAGRDNAVLREPLRRRILWAEHNLASDGSFNEFQIVLCRNVMIYFNRTLQARVHELIYHSLAGDGVLGLGQGESLTGTPFAAAYAVLDREQRLYRKLP